MKYDLTAKLFPIIFDKYAYALFGKEHFKKVAKPMLSGRKRMGFS